ncbi:2-isopropylmalate synthase [Paenibacillus baekrokdamisoli]|uniref:2-isopropylmalate synthase n=1 Tax=Paenibacillus baekrokdamisoli TaxID=1712516 RepID=A0A3G9JF51_9BACL|nr:2-isopropylmalate synthase [Paenibacillus baekrokdamisoli]MBB3071436.1 2-isopropylmalate synthase [Paenibacillus baekrokdamisoli]BBH24531.1 2-isopropylmalate synthase [Paenibacillus baekrokdamisoli]
MTINQSQTNPSVNAINNSDALQRIRIFDTTLRDGEQSPGATLAPEQKIILARQLAKLGVDIIEPGFPISSPGDFAAVQQISRELHNVEIVGFARAMKVDIDAAVRATADAARRRLHLFISSSDIHLDFQLKKTREQVMQIAREMVAYGKQFVDEIEFSPMDASRSGREFVIEMVEAVIAEGATVINLPDTLGYAMPEEYEEMFRSVRRQARGGDKVVFSAHCHNDLGLAVANSLAAIRGGATQVEVTVNGIGERAGNCSLEELVMAIETRKSAIGVQTGIVTSEIYETSRMVSRAMNFPIAYNKPIVGRNAFQHESGIHQDGLLKNRNTFEIMDPEAMGIPRSMIVLGKHSGRHAIKHRLNEFGITLNEEQLVDVYNRFIAKADELKLVPDNELIRLASESTDMQHDPYSLVHLQVMAGTNESRIASVTIRERDSQEDSNFTGTGKGPLEAVIHCIQQAIPEAGEFEDLELHSLSTGEDARGEAIVSIVHNNVRYRGTAIHNDIILAAAQAYVAACNQQLLSGQTSDAKQGA